MTKEINSIDKAVAAGLSNNQVMVLLVWTHRIVLYSYIVGCLLPVVCSVHTMETHVNVSTCRPLLGLDDDSYVSYIFRFRGYRLADGVVDGSRPVDRSCRSAPRADIGRPGGPRRASPSSTSPDSLVRRAVACRSNRDAFSYTLDRQRLNPGLRAFLNTMCVRDAPRVATTHRPGGDDTFRVHRGSIHVLVHRRRRALPP